MPKQDYIPRGDDDYLIWHNQFKATAISIGATVSLTPGEITDITNDNASALTTITNSKAADQTAQTATNLKDTAIGNGKQRARKLARRIKEQPNYTPAIGEQFGIEGPEDTTDMTTAKPTLKGRALPMAAIEIG